MTEKVSTEVVTPMAVAVIATEDGRLKNTTAVTPPGQPNLNVRVITPIIALIVRAANLFFITLSGTLVVSAFSDGSLKEVVIQTLAIVALGVVKDCATIFGNLERKYPLATGSI